MKKLALIGLATLALNVLADDKYIIAPYVVIGDDNKLSLNFQTAQPQNLTVDVRFKNKNSFLEQSQKLNLKANNYDFQKVDLGTLACDTEVKYSLSSNNGFISEDHSFKSLPCNKEEPLYFGFISDSQIKDAAGQKRADRISQTVEDLKNLYPFSIIVNAGDAVQHGGRNEDWLNYFNTSKVYLHNTYMVSAVGNHEYYDSPMYEKAPPQFRKYLRDDSSPELGNAAVDLGKLTVIVLNSNFDFMNEATYKEQWDWFISKLEENQKKNKPVIVSMHHSPFSSSMEWIREIPKRLRADLVPTLEKYSCVKMMISGHLHMYERSEKNNLQYLVAGPSGGIINYITFKNPYQVTIKPFSTTFTVFKVTDKQIEVTTFTGLKEMIDHFVVKL